jgi:hypothetical protein
MDDVKQYALKTYYYVPSPSDILLKGKQQKCSCDHSLARSRTPTISSFTVDGRVSFICTCAEISTPSFMVRPIHFFR